MAERLDIAAIRFPGSSVATLIEHQRSRDQPEPLLDQRAKDRLRQGMPLIVLIPGGDLTDRIQEYGPHG